MCHVLLVCLCLFPAPAHLRYSVFLLGSCVPVLLLSLIFPPYQSFKWAGTDWYIFLFWYMSTGVLFFLNMWAHNKCTQLENTKAATAKCNAIQYTNKNSYNCKPAPKTQTIMNNQKYI